VCQDHAQVFLAASRLLGLPARYVSGYLHSPEGNSSHAWAEAWLGRHWHVFDISNARHPQGALVKLAIGLDYLDACPVRGVRLGGGEERLETVAEVRSTQ
jgi:transglutaminase-like putative cysteine protease